MRRSLVAIVLAACGGTATTVHRSSEPAPAEGVAAQTAEDFPAGPAATTLVEEVVPSGFRWAVNQATAGPGGLLAFAHGRQVAVLDVSADALIGTITMEPDGTANQMPRQLKAVGFVGDDRIVFGTSGGLEVASLRDTDQRQRLEERADTGMYFVTIDDGVLVAMASGEILRLVGHPLERAGAWRLPGYPVRPQSLALAGDTILATAEGHLYAIDGEGIREVPIPGFTPGRFSSLRVEVGTDIVVAVDEDRLVRLARSSFELLSETRAESAEHLWGLSCDADSHRCYWARGQAVEVWKDDLSERIARAEGQLAIHPGTGRLVRQGSAGLEIADGVGARWRPLLSSGLVATGFAFSSRPGELLLTYDAEAYVLSLEGLRLRALENVSAPLVVGFDGAVIGTGRHGELVVLDAGLEEQRRIASRGCDLARIAALSEQDTERADDQIDRIASACEARAPVLLEPAHGQPRVALMDARGALSAVDYAEGRWLGEWLNVAGGEEREPRSIAWSPGGDLADVTFDGQAFQVALGEPRPRSPAEGGMTRGRAYAADGALGWVDWNGKLHVAREAAEETVVELGFEADALFAGPDGRWLAFGHGTAVLVEHGAAGERRSAGMSRSLPVVRWGGPQPVIATALESGGVRLTRMGDGAQSTLLFVKRGEETDLVARWGDRYQVPPGVRPPFHYRAGETDLLGRIERATTEGSADGLVARFLAE